MFTSINEYRNSLNESQLPDNFFDAIRASAAAFDTEYQEIGSGFTYLDVDGEVNNVVVLDDNEAMVNGEKMTLHEFINLLTNDEPELLYEMKVNEMASAFQEEAMRAIEKANGLGFNFDINQRRNTVFFYTQPINVGLVESVEYDLLRTMNGNVGRWRVMCKINHNIPEATNVTTANLDRDSWNQNMVVKTFVCMFTLD